MKMKKIIITVLLMLPISLFASGIDEGLTKAIQWAQGGEILEDWFMKSFISDYKAVMVKNWDSYVGIARVIGAIGALVVFSQKAYEMMVGEGLKIMPLLRPFGILLIIINWTAFVQFIDAPMNILNNKASSDYYNAVNNINNLRLQKKVLQDHVIDNLFEVQAEADVAVETGKKSWMESVGDWMKDGVDKVLLPLYKTRVRFQIAMQSLATQLTELLALWILRIMVYTVFTIQMVFSIILIMLGPLSAGFSIFPMFKDSFSTWVGRYISVQFYSVTGFIILIVTNTLLQFGLEAEILKLGEVVSSDGVIKDHAKLFFMQSQGFLSYGATVIVYIITGLVFLTVPTVSTWIVSSSGITGAVQSMSRTVTAGVMGAKMGSKGK